MIFRFDLLFLAISVAEVIVYGELIQKGTATSKVTNIYKDILTKSKRPEDLKQWKDAYKNLCNAM